MDSSISRDMKQIIDPIHVMIYFAPEPQEEYAALGLEGRAEGYFPPRAAPLGRVPWQVVQATFFGFSPLAVQFGMTEAWNKTTPEEATAARLRGADRALRRMAGEFLDDTATITEALALCRTAAGACPVAGRPLFAAQQSLPEPEQPHLALWHQIAALREYRGDGHLAALVAADVDGPQSLVLHAGVQGGGTAEFLQASRAWGPEVWAAAVDALVARGWVEADGSLTEAGRTAREDLETQTDLLGMAPWRALGEDGCARLVALLTPLADAIRAAGELPDAAVPAAGTTA
ncbi:MAG: hypothetical protein ABIO67_04405 [Mycobacteriales bacterium]